MIVSLTLYKAEFKNIEKGNSQASAQIYRIGIRPNVENMKEQKAARVLEQCAGGTVSLFS